MNSPLFIIESLLAERRTPLQLFIRNDDVSDDEPRLRQLLALGEKHRVPLTLAVIPGLLTEGAIELLNQQDDLIELQQHGWQHTNHETCGKKCEFGASRDNAAQHADLAAGQARMNEAFGTRWFPAFTPPWNRCTAATAQGLIDLSFCALSRDVSQASFDDPRLPEFPVTLDLFRWRGGAALRPSDELHQELARQIRHTDRIGMMLHHQVMDDAAFALLDEWLTVLTQSPLVRFHTLQTLLEAQ
jgi:peptidoglycan/xylan/chitin deacetylase (PgdA/CDA1 family)